MMREDYVVAVVLEGKRLIMEDEEGKRRAIEIEDDAFVGVVEEKRLLMEDEEGKRRAMEIDMW